MHLAINSAITHAVNFYYVIYITVYLGKRVFSVIEIKHHQRRQVLTKHFKSTLIVLVSALLIALYFFYKNGYVISEMFFFVGFCDLWDLLLIPMDG